MHQRMRMQTRHRPLFHMRRRNVLRKRIIVYGATFLMALVPIYTYMQLGSYKDAYAGTMTAAANGNWTSASTWSAGRVPQDGDTIVIPIGRTVTVDVVTASYNHLLIIVNGTLYFNGGKKIIMCEGMVVVAPGGLLSAANAGSKFEICGSFLWDGNDPGAGPLSFGAFTGATPLPVELASFTAAQENNNVNVEWETVSQTNCDYFSVETSTNGLDYAPLINIKAKGNSTGRDKYAYLHANVPSGINYYRLTQVDFDGASKTFPPVSVMVRKNSDVSVYPNPVPVGGTATIDMPAGTMNEMVEINALNMEGKKIFSQIFLNPEAKNKSLTLQTNAFPAAGTYLLIVSGSNFKAAKKILVQ